MHALRKHCLSVCFVIGLSVSNILIDTIRADDLPRIRKDVVYGHKDGMALTMDVFEPEANRKGIGLMFMVSGGWVSTWMPPAQMSNFFKPLLDEGYTIIAVRHGSSPKYVIPEIVEDVRKALELVNKEAQDWKIDKSKIGVFGFSAGGHLSLMLGTTANDKKEVLVSQP